MAVMCTWVGAVIGSAGVIIATEALEAEVVRSWASTLKTCVVLGCNLVTVNAVTPLATELTRVDCVPSRRKMRNPCSPMTSCHVNFTSVGDSATACNPVGAATDKHCRSSSTSTTGRHAFDPDFWRSCNANSIKDIAEPPCSRKVEETSNEPAEL